MLAPRFGMDARARGFTLIELLVVIAIIGVLSSVVLASLNTARAKSRDAYRLAEMKQVVDALEMYANDHNGSYPLPAGGSGAWSSQCAAWGSFAPNSVISGLAPTYISALPVDPAMVVASNQNCFIYNSNGTDYKFIDYNIVDSPNPGAYTSALDPMRNYGQSYSRPPGCSGTEATRTFGFYTAGAICW